MLSCVIFDLDHTLVNSDLDFARIKAEIGTDMPILEYRDTVDAAGKKRIDGILDRHECRAAAKCDLTAGAQELLDFLQKRGVKTALLTRNSRKSVRTIMERHGMAFDCVLTRQDSEPKPSPAPVRLICRKLGIAPGDAIMVGDYLYDMQSGRRAGAMTLLVDSPHRHIFEFDADYEVASLHEALDVIKSLLDGLGTAKQQENGSPQSPTRHSRYGDGTRARRTLRTNKETARPR